MSKTPIADQLRREIAFFEGHPERWTQGVSARRADGEKTGYESPNAVCFCQSGARNHILSAYSEIRWKYPKLLSKTTDLVDSVAVSMGYRSAIQLNDHSDFPTVMEMLYIALAHAEGAGV